MSPHKFLGGDTIYRLTSQKRYTLAIDVLLWNSTVFSAQYSQFAVASETNLYRLTVGGYSGNTGDGFTEHNGCSWSTYDRDNSGYGCANHYFGPWWYCSSNFCYRINLNNLYWSNGVCEYSPTDSCITLIKLKSLGLPIKSVTMKIKAFS